MQTKDEAEADGELAIKFAAILAKTWKVRDWRELVASAWEGIKKGRRYGAVDEAHLFLYARGRTMYDRVYEVYGMSPHYYFTKKYYRLKHNLKYQDEYVENRHHPDDPLTVWNEYSRERAGINIRLRVAAYLRLVEGMTYEEAAAAMGVSKLKFGKLYRDFLVKLEKARRSRRDISGHRDDG